MPRGNDPRPRRREEAEPQIREALEADAAAARRYLAVIRAERLPALYARDDVPSLDDQREFLLRCSVSANSFVLIAELDGEVLGMLDLCGHALPQCAHAGLIGMSVREDWRSRGIGSALLDETFRRADRCGVLRIELEVFSNNPRAAALYERKGFVLEGRRRAAAVVAGRYVDILLMARCDPKLDGDPPADI